MTAISKDSLTDFEEKYVPACVKKATTKYQLERDGELYSTLYDRFHEAMKAGEMLVQCGWIKSYEIRPKKAVWIKA